MISQGREVTRIRREGLQRLYAIAYVSFAYIQIGLRIGSLPKDEEEKAKSETPFLSISNK